MSTSDVVTDGFWLRAALVFCSALGIDCSKTSVEEDILMSFVFPLIVARTLARTARFILQPLSCAFPGIAIPGGITFPGGIAFPEKLFRFGVYRFIL